LRHAAHLGAIASLVEPIEGKTRGPTSIRIGSVAFDLLADYDADNDALSSHVGEPQEAEGEETPEIMSCASSLARRRVLLETLVSMWSLR
jgi:hypothetical protein